MSVFQKRVTIGEDEVKKGHTIKPKDLDLDLLEKYLEGKSIVELSQIRCVSPQSIETKLKTTVLSLKSTAPLLIINCDLNYIRNENLTWQKAIEFYKQEQYRKDPDGMYQYALSWAKALTRSELQRFITDCEQAYEQKFGNTF